MVSFRGASKDANPESRDSGSTLRVSRNDGESSSAL